LQKLISLRKKQAAFSGNELEIVWTGNDRVLGYRRVHNGLQAFVFTNFSEQKQNVPRQALERYVPQIHHRLHGNSRYVPGEDLILEPLDFLLFSGASSST
jgi:hypothetical protein